jgi:hypothetical protein
MHYKKRCKEITIQMEVRDPIVGFITAKLYEGRLMGWLLHASTNTKPHQAQILRKQG